MTARETQDRQQESPPPGKRMSRRAAMFGAGGLAAGAVGAGIALVAVPTSAAPNTAELDAVARETPLTEDLMNEHGMLIRIILIYREVTRRVQAGEPVPRAQAHDASLIIEQFIHGFHEPLEEAYIFPPVNRGALKPGISALLLQHARGREQTQAILTASAGSGTLVEGASRARLAAAMDAFTRVYEIHEAREDTVVYPALRAASSPREMVQMAEHFNTLQTQQFGPDIFQKMLGRVVTIEQALDIYDLNKFTPPQITG
ncbi:MAG TPA: hemerythrin domain-containing protein [Streptosporangiaceae bacterium]|jgi:hemerythrin-like domain-containing protein